MPDDDSPTTPPAPRRRGRPKGSVNRNPGPPPEGFRPIASEYLTATRAAADGAAPLPTAEALALDGQRLHGAAWMPSAALDEIEATPLVWARGDSTRDADALVVRLRGGLRAVVVEMRPNTRPRARDAPAGPQEPPEVVVALRTAFGSAITPYGRDGAALAGQCGRDVGTGAPWDETPAWSLDGVTLGPDAAVLWERVVLPAETPTPLAPETLRRALGLALLRLYARVKHGALSARMGMPCIPYHTALRTAWHLGKSARRVPPNAGRHPEAHAQWVLAHALRALYGRNPAGAAWPYLSVGRFGLEHDGHWAHPEVMRYADGYRSELVTVASELAAVVPRAAGGPSLAEVAAAEAPGWGFARHDAFAGLTRHPALAELLGHVMATFDARNPSASLLCRALGPPRRAGEPLDVLARRYGYTGASALPPQGRAFHRPHRTGAGMRLAAEGVPLDAQALTPCGYSPIPTASVRAPVPVASTRVDLGAWVAKSPLGAPGEPPTRAAGLVLQPFTYAVEHPDFARAAAELDRRVAADVRALNRAEGVESWDRRAFLAAQHGDAVGALLPSPMWRVRAIVDPDPRGVVADLERAVNAFVAWLLSPGALSAVPTPLLDPHARTDFDVMARVFRVMPPRVTVQWRCAEDYPAGVPTVALWCPLDAEAVMPVAIHADAPAATTDPTERVMHALVTLWATLTVGVAPMWGPVAEGAVLDALTAPAPAPALTPLGIAHAVLDTALRHRVAARRAFQCDPLVTRYAPQAANRAALRAAGHAVLYPILGEYRMGPEVSAATRRGALGWRRALRKGLDAPEDTTGPRANAAALDVLGYAAGPDGLPALLPPSESSSTPPEAPQHPHASGALGATPTGRGAYAAAGRLSRVRAALWPLAPGTTPRRVAAADTQSADPFPGVLPMRFVTGAAPSRDVRDASSHGAGRRALERMGFRVLLTIHASPYGIVAPPWVGPLDATPRVAVPHGEAFASGMWRELWALPGHARPFTQAALNSYGAALQSAILAVLDAAPPGLYRPGTDALAPADTSDPELAALGLPPWVVPHVPAGASVPTLYEGPGSEGAPAALPYARESPRKGLRRQPVKPRA